MKLFIKMLLLLIATQYWGCRKECGCNIATNPDCDNYNPCLGSAQPSADFYAYYYNYATPDDPFI